MRRTASTVAVVLFLLGGGLAEADPGADDREASVSTQMGEREITIRAEKVAPGIFFLHSGAGGNMALCIGEDGAFLVDDQYAPLTDAIRQVIGQLTDEPVRFVLNTHWHADHTGGNENLGELGTVIVAHDNVRQRMSTEQVMAFFGRTVPPSPDESGLRPRLHSIYQHIAEFVIAGMQVTQVFSVRLAILTLAMPVFVLFSLVALVDGFVKRDLRRWGGGRESSFVYHWAKRSAMPLLITSWVIYLALPFSLHPTFIVLPFATLFALSVAVTASTFKKYL